MHNEFIQKYADYHEVEYEVAEAEIVKALYEVSRAVSPRFRFGFHDNEDMIQQGIIEAFESFNKYKFDRPLKPFLRSCIHNGMFNFKRKNFCRMEIPCRCCEVDTLTPCDKYEKWLKNNNTKKSIVVPGSLDFDPYCPKAKPSFVGDLKEAMPDDLHKSLDRVLRGKFVGKKKMERLNEHVNDKGVD